MVKNLFLAVMVVLALAGASFAQTTYLTTTLGASIDNTQTIVPVASNTGMGPTNNPLMAGPGANLVRQLAAIDLEMVEIYSTIGTTQIQVVRGAAGTTATKHANATLVLFGPPVLFGAGEKSGACTETSELVLPLISVDKGLKSTRMFNCIGGVWLPQNMPGHVSQPSLFKACNVPIGSVAYASIGTDTTPSTTAALEASIFVPQTMLVTTVGTMNGTAVDGTSHKTVALYSLGGRLLGKSASTTAATNSVLQNIALTSTLLISGPATYIVFLEDDTADVGGVETIKASTYNNVFTGNPVSVYGTIPASITVPTTFTADVGPIACLQ